MAKWLQGKHMSTQTLRTFVIASVLLFLGVVLMQFHWFKEAYKQEDRDFEHRCTGALQAVTKRLLKYNNNPNNMVLKPVERVSAKYFTVQINDQINPLVLEEFLRQEFTRNDVKQNFEYGVYDCNVNKIRYGGFVCNTADCDTTRSVKYEFPQLAGYNYYFGIYFPDKQLNLFYELGGWIVSSMILLVVLCFFGYALWVIFKQKRLSEIQTDFINNMTHEFKTPISTISISSEVLMKPDIINQPERLLSYAAIIRKEAARLKKNVDTVLQTANIAQKIDKLKLEDTNVHEILEELCQNLEPILKEKSASLSFELKASNAIIKADRIHLTNVIHNLIDNSLKYCEEAPVVNIWTTNEGRNLQIFIKDNGIGIADKDQKLIFSKFYRVHTGDVHNVKGFGLGLYYVKEMIEGHRGEINLKSKLGEGSTFTITLPNV
jgi:two-component system, OmpR family, phosphate regulon sensor histidine kinase PhoR